MAFSLGKQSFSKYSQLNTALKTKCEVFDAFRQLLSIYPKIIKHLNKYASGNHYKV